MTRPASPTGDDARRLTDAPQTRTGSDMPSLHNSLDADGQNQPILQSSMSSAAQAAIPLGLACAAVATTYLAKHERIAVTAWVAVAIIGTASVISSAVALHPRQSRLRPVVKPTTFG